MALDVSGAVVAALDFSCGAKKNTGVPSSWFCERLGTGF
jgi:hypothetical protein